MRSAVAPRSRSLAPATAGPRRAAPRALAVGTHPIAASYGGDAGNTAIHQRSRCHRSSPPPEAAPAATWRWPVPAAWPRRRALTPRPTRSARSTTTSAPAPAGATAAAGPTARRAPSRTGCRSSSTAARPSIGWWSIRCRTTYTQPVEPTDSTTFATYGITAFTVQGWNGTSWITLATVSWQQPRQAHASASRPTSTDRIRHQHHRRPRRRSYLTEVEAWTAAGGPADRRRPRPRCRARSIRRAAGASVTLHGDGDRDQSRPATSASPTTAARSAAAPPWRSPAAGNSQHRDVHAPAALAVGTHSIVASYAGDAGNAASDQRCAVASHHRRRRRRQQQRGAGQCRRRGLGVEHLRAGLPGQRDQQQRARRHRLGQRRRLGRRHAGHLPGLGADHLQRQQDHRSGGGLFAAGQLHTSRSSPPTARPLPPTASPPSRCRAGTGRAGSPWPRSAATTLVKRSGQLPAPTSTDRIRINITAARGAGSYLTEVEAWTAAGGPGGPTSTTTTLASSLNPAPAGASVTLHRRR